MVLSGRPHRFVLTSGCWRMWPSLPVIAALFLLINLSTARAENYEVSLSTDAAAAQPTLTTTITDTHEELSTFILKFPEGMTFNPRATPWCSEEEFGQRNEENTADCNENTKVGSIAIGNLRASARRSIREHIIDNCDDYLDWTICRLPNSTIRAGINAELNDFDDLSGSVYLGEPYDGSSAVKARLFAEIETPSGESSVDTGRIAERLGRVFPGNVIKFSCNVILRSVPYIGYGRHALDQNVVVTDIPDGGNSLGCRAPREYMWMVEELELTLQENIDQFDSPAITNPTVCGIAEFRASFYSRNNPGLRDIPPSNQTRISGCEESLSFNPSFSVAVDPSQSEDASEVVARITQSFDIDNGEYHNAHLKKVRLMFPDSYGLRIPDDMVWCQPDGNLMERNCPANAKIGEVKVQTIYSEEPSTGSLYLLYPNLLFARIHTVMFADGFAPFRLMADLVPTGRGFELRIDDLPQLPVSELEITLYGGDRGFIRAPQCQPGSVDATFRSHSRIDQQIRMPVDTEDACASSDESADSEGNEKKRQRSSEKKNQEKSSEHARQGSRQSRSSQKKRFKSKHKKTRVRVFSHR